MQLHARRFPMNDIAYGLATSAQIAGMTGKQILQAMIDGKLPAPPIAQTLSFWLNRGRRRLRGFRGRTGRAFAQSVGRGSWRMGVDAHRQRHRLRRADIAARRRRLRDGRDQGQLLPPDHQGHRTGSRRVARRLAGTASDLGRGAGLEPRRKSLGSRDIHAPCLRQRKIIALR